MKDTPLKNLIPRLNDVMKTANGWTACCPAHDDHQRSLNISEATDGAVLVKCRAGCGAEQVVSAVGLKLRGLFPSKAEKQATDDESEDAGEPWPPLIPFDSDALPGFPVEALPSPLKEWVMAESHATQTPPDLAALLAIATCAASIAKRVTVTAREGWVEPVNLYTAVQLEPGNRKSAVFQDAVRPLREYEEQLIDAARPECARLESERRQNEARLRLLEKKAGEKRDASIAHEASELAAKLAAEVEPVLPRLIVDDATSEKLGIMLSEQGGRLASMSPEGGVFDIMAGLYSKNGAPQFVEYLKGHSGDDLVTDRISRKSVHVKQPALTCAYAMQPQVIRGMARNPAFRGRGLLARFLFAAPRSWIGSRKIATTPVSEKIRDEYYQKVKYLAFTQGEHVLELTPDAVTLLTAWESEIEDMLGDGGRLENLRDWGGKLAGATRRLAGVLHCVEFDENGPIDHETLAAAIKIARYLIPHAEETMRLMEGAEDPLDSDAAYIVRWIQRHEVAQFTKSEAQHCGKRRFPKAVDIDSPLEELERRRYVRRKVVVSSGSGRPQSPAYEVNPAILAIEGAPTRSQYSRNRAQDDADGNSGNNGSALPEADPEIEDGFSDADCIGEECHDELVTVATDDDIPF